MPRDRVKIVQQKLLFSLWKCFRRLLYRSSKLHFEFSISVPGLMFKVQKI